ncbi:MAG: PepSY-associated TM helix domain-containing protein [Bacteroidales bacterium]
MKWRKLNRALHRDLGYIFFGMTIIYSVSGIVLNHRKPGGDASIVTRSENIQVQPVEKENLDKNYIFSLLENQEIETSEYKNYYFPNDNTVMIYLDEGHIELTMDSGEGKLVIIRKRPVLTEFNFLHYNKPKKLWTWVSDIFAGSLIAMAITGLFILKGKNGITNRGAWLVSFGVLVPLVFLIIYMWAA